MYNRIISTVISAVVLMSLAGCGIQQTADLSAAVQSDIVEDIKKEYTSSAYINDEKGLLNDDQKQLMYNFALCYADTLKDMQPADFKPLFVQSDGEQSFLNQTAYTVLTAVRSMSDKELSLEKAEIVYNIQTAADYGNKVVVELIEDNVQKFRHLDENSYSCNIYHKFVIANTENGWKVESHLHEEDFFLLAEEAWNDADGTDLLQKSENSVNLIIADAQENFALKSENLNEYTDVAVAK